MHYMTNNTDENLIDREMEARAFLNELDDTKEAAAAFAEKRTPEFKGK
jgi:hypothetical protein